MKRLTMACLVATLFCIAACDQKKEESATTTQAGNEDQHKQMMEANRAVYRAIETGDTAVLRKHIAADAVDHGGGMDGKDLKGEEIINMLASVHNDIDNLKVETLQEAANDDHVFALVHMTGTTNKAVWGMPAGHKMDSKSVDVVKIKDMKMTDHWGYFDMAEMMQMQQGAKTMDSTMKK